MTAAALPGDWSNLIVVVGAVRWDGSRMLDQHLALGLARYAPVLYIDTAKPWRPSQGRRLPMVGRHADLRLLQPGVALATPHVLPGHQRPGMKALSIALVRRTMAQAVADLGSPSVRAVIIPSLDRCFGACGEERKVFYASDDFVAGGDLMRLSARRLRREAQRQPRQADLVVASSPTLADGLRAEGHDPLMLPNGCDPEAFAGTEQTPPAPDVALDGPVAGFMGHLSGRVDVRYLDALAARGHNLLLVGPGAHGGPGEDLERLVRRDNVQWVGPREFSALRSYLRHIDLGLVPYADTSFNRASFPLKALEYLAAGRPVLSTDIPAIRWLREGRNVGAPAGSAMITGDDIVVADSPRAFADAAEKLLLAERDEEAIARRLDFARQHSWDQRFAVLADRLGLAPTGMA